MKKGLSFLPLCYNKFQILKKLLKNVLQVLFLITLFSLSKINFLLDFYSIFYQVVCHRGSLYK